MCLFKKAMNRSNGSDFVFPSPTTEGPITGHAVAKAMHRSRAVFGLSNPVTPHDLRRTAASFMGELGFSRLIQDKVLNHITTDNSSISGVYDRYSYMREKREALETWANHLIQILRGNRHSVSSERNNSFAA